ncbi:MAG: hypothetical protein JO263_01965, partial [Candidatus Eremiobacteraeota bacterium]|nr:hypothetical protein [Candidatus Eremiobacteraeota bacterium]
MGTRYKLAVLTLLCSLLSACGGSGGGTPSVLTANRPVTVTSSQVIKHIVVIIQENRTLDNLFMGFPGADTASSGTMSDGTTVQLAPVPLEQGPDIDHSRANFLRQYAGGNLFFDLGAPPGAGPSYPSGYVPREEPAPYWALAQQWTFGDRMFQTNGGPSYPAHQYLIAGQSGRLVDNPNGFPWGCDAAAGVVTNTVDAGGNPATPTPPCVDYTTLADKLEKNGLTWRYYAPVYGTTNGYQWSAFDAIRHIRYGPDWTSAVISPETSVLADAAAGTLPAVTWVAPSFANSDH